VLDNVLGLCLDSNRRKRKGKEMKTCENLIERNGEWVACGNGATAWHWDCCDGYYGVDVCADCLPLMDGGATTMCDWYNTVDDVVVSSSNPEEIGVSYK
jgi:hypothetical protein